MTEPTSPDLRSFNAFFDHIYVLTLDRAIQRQTEIARVLKGFDWHFFRGVDKFDLDVDALIRDGLYDDKRHRHTKRTSRPMSLGEIACAMSHRAIYQDAIDNGYRRILIFEDDVAPDIANLAAFSETVGQLPDDWELLMLGYYSEKYPTAKTRFQEQVYLTYHKLGLFNWHKVNRRFLERLLMRPYSSELYEIGKLVGGHAYAMTQSACRKFVDFQTPIFLQADRVFNYYQAVADLKAFAVKRKMFHPSDMAEQSLIGYPNSFVKAQKLLAGLFLPWGRSEPGEVNLVSSSGESFPNESQ
ncbi:Glycosyltransferase family 25 protein [Sulfidibacter corallicola]|uniref:Glycosyltransferase family 25 protein n=1 Tax=Sulfidibacter corallicola TaxID=2818388 RepID=A0A8A4TMV3_SULCO|nr:glycosyltransferase family 25 protein [Sulfidibacter corallicola]QTD50432.1 glycosyltransferase family 25 protein [Sulfidibacter corallicola]